MSTPVLASFAIFQFLWVWNDLLNALVFIPGENQPLPIALVQLLGQQGGMAVPDGGRPVHDDRADHRVPVAAVLRPWDDRRRGQGLTAAVGVSSFRCALDGPQRDG